VYVANLRARGHLLLIDGGGKAERRIDLLQALHLLLRSDSPPAPLVVRGAASDRMSDYYHIWTYVL